jgi:hypothetical protein
MGSGRGKRRAVPDIQDCADFALCTAGAELGWTAIDPCSGCVATAMRTPKCEPANPGVSRPADPARLVTADEFEELLSLVRRARASEGTSAL